MKQLSIILPFYNREPYLAECLDSIFDSNCRDFELILIDDASTDTGGGDLQEIYGMLSLCQNDITQHTEGTWRQPQ